MDTRLMLLPATAIDKIRLVTIPRDYEEQEAFRHVVGIIAAVEEDHGSGEDIIDALEEQGFVPQRFMLGPELS